MILAAKQPGATGLKTAWLVAAWLLIATLFLLSGCEKAPQVHKWSGQTMGTHYAITVVEHKGTQPPFDLPQAQSWVEAELQALNQAMSTYREDAEITRFSQLAAPGCQSVSEPFAQVLTLALDVAERSDGAFNPLVAPLVERWGFGREQQPFEFPQVDEIARLQSLASLEQLQFDPATARLCKTGAVALDFSAIAKGYAVDRLAEGLTAMGAEHYLVDIGGEVRVRGQNPGGVAWRLAIEKPQAGFGHVQQVVHLFDDSAIATSGDYRNFFDYQGQRYSHTIDPRTGYPVEHNTASVSVIAATAAAADAWATALTVLPPTQVSALAVEESLAVYMLTRENTAQSPDESEPGYSIWYSPGFKPYLDAPTSN